MGSHAWDPRPYKLHSTLGLPQTVWTWTCVGQDTRPYWRNAGLRSREKLLALRWRQYGRLRELCAAAGNRLDYASGTGARRRDVEEVDKLEARERA